MEYATQIEKDRIIAAQALLDCQRDGGMISRSQHVAASRALKARWIEVMNERQADKIKEWRKDRDNESGELLMF